MAHVMKKVMSVLVLGMSSSMLYAGSETTDRPIKPPTPTGCGTECSGKIDIELKVDPHCDLDVETAKITLEDKAGGDVKNGQFKVGANAAYKIDLSTANGQKLKTPSSSVPIPITITTTRGSTSIPFGTTTNEPYTLGGWTAYNVKVQSPETGVGFAAGTYTEQYRIRVFF